MSSKPLLVIAILLLSSLPSWAAVGLRDSNNAGSNSQVATSLATGSVDVRRGDTIVVAVVFGAGGSTATSIADTNGDTFTHQCDVTQYQPNGNMDRDRFYQ